MCQKSNSPSADPPDVADVLAAFGLPVPTRIDRGGGTATPKWAVRTNAGRFMVRVRPAEFSGDESVSFDHTAMRRLADEGLPVPRPQVRPDGTTWLARHGRVYEVLSWVDGRPFVEGDLRAIASVGEFLGRFHGVFGGETPAGKAGMLREDHPDLLAPYLADLLPLAAGAAEAEALAEISRQLDLVRGQLDGGVYASLPHCVIHGDVHPGNVRFRGSHVAAAYDFDYLSVQARIRDICDGLVAFASRRAAPLDPDEIRSLTQAFVPDPDRCGELMRAYQRHNALSDAEWTALPWTMRSRWLQMRLRGSRKVPAEEKVSYVLDRFFDVIDWLDRSGPAFFDKLRAGQSSAAK